MYYFYIFYMLFYIYYILFLYILYIFTYFCIFYIFLYIFYIFKIYFYIFLALNLITVLQKQVVKSILPGLRVITSLAKGRNFFAFILMKIQIFQLSDHLERILSPGKPENIQTVPFIQTTTSNKSSFKSTFPFVLLLVEREASIRDLLQICFVPINHSGDGKPNQGISAGFS